MECIAVDNIAKDDYIYIHYDGKLFNGNDYPFELRGGIAKHDILIGQYVVYDEEGRETIDVKPRPQMPSIEEHMKLIWGEETIE